MTRTWTRERNRVVLCHWVIASVSSASSTLSVLFFIFWVDHRNGALSMKLWGGQSRASFCTHYSACFRKVPCVIRVSSFINLACSYFEPRGHWWQIRGPHTCEASKRSLAKVRPLPDTLFLTCSFILVFDHELVSTFVSLALCYNCCVETC